jgi:hypothetical protein
VIQGSRKHDAWVTQASSKGRSRQVLCLQQQFKKARRGEESKKDSGGRQVVEGRNRPLKSLSVGYGGKNGRLRPKKAGGDDETRTRDLCRDRAAF